MSLLAVKDYAASVIIPSVVIPASVTKWRKIKVYRQMPKMTAPLGSNCVVILGNIDDIEVRKSFRRGGGGVNDSGDKEIVYQIPFLIHANASDEKAGADQFDVLVWAIRTAFRNTATGLDILDPFTSEDSFLMAVGEQMKGKQLTPIEVAIEGTEATQVNFEYILTVTFKEWIQS